ncbi:MAG TPA: hypothetical protein VM100_02065, partial [Longimicrobiales bacterium]|nr:hypothetical protein [Longimicrobiales bacterium]
IVSNLPYVSEQDRETLQPEVNDYEPHMALFAGEDGLAVINRLIAQSLDRLTAHALLALEIGHDQAAVVRDMLEATKQYENIEIVKDLAKRDRIITATRIRQDV